MQENTRLICTGSWKSGKKCTYPQKYDDRCGHHKIEGVEKIKRNICTAIEEDGNPCTEVWTNGKYCDKHAEIEIQNQKEKDKQIQIRPKMIEYFLKIGEIFKLGLELTNDDFVSKRISEDEYTSEQLEKDFHERIVYQEEKFILTNNPLLFKYKPNNSSNLKFRYFIGLVFKGISLVITPVFMKKDMISQFCCVLYQNFDIIKTVRLSHSDKIYPCSSENVKLQEMIHGKKAEDQGWFLVNKNDPHNSVEAIWITMLSGRSINQFFPNHIIKLLLLVVK